jgi:hypothetical protein
MDQEYIKKKIKKCIDEFYLNESVLLKRENYEVTISCKFSQYLFIEFPQFDVDCEYDKHINEEKRVEELNQNIRPDIIIHKRGIDDNNLVYIEIKTDHNRTTRNKDYTKIKALTKQSGSYKYRLGVFIDFNRNKDNLVVKFFEDGKECN